MNLLRIAAWLVALAPGFAAAAAPRAVREDSYSAMMRRHYDRVIAAGRDTYGDDRSNLWLASVDVRRGGLPAKADPAVKRTYREIHAPRGSNLYWDQPYVVAAYQLSRLSGESRYQAAADA